ncbi:hypothetical protein EDB87DRAFT_1644965 [Lactarius vividus]|nr:hypothetical protein EDB87DRAFT_1644965 [Lactarius vividus]
MSGEQAKTPTTSAEQPPHPPAIPQYPFPGAPYPPPPGAYTWYYPPPADPNGDPNAPPPGSYVMFPPPGIMYGYPPPPAPPQGYGQFPAPAPPAVTRAKRKQVKMACTNCAAACKRCDDSRPCLRCQKYGLVDSCRDGVRKARKVGTKRGPYKRKNKLPAPETPPYPGFPPNGEGSWPAPPDQANGVPPGAPPAMPTQYLPPEGYWPYPYYPPPPGYVPPPDGHTNGDGQPPHQPAYYPIHPGYPTMAIYPPHPGAYGPIPPPPGQAHPPPSAEQAGGNQTAALDEENPPAERGKKKKRLVVGDDTSKPVKRAKKIKRIANPANEVVVATASASPAPLSIDSHDDRGSPVVHNVPISADAEPLPPVIAAA